MATHRPAFAPFSAALSLSQGASLDMGHGWRQPETCYSALERWYRIWAYLYIMPHRFAEEVEARGVDAGDYRYKYIES